MTPLARLAAAAARIVAGPQETRVILLYDDAEAYRSGWSWPEGRQALVRLRHRIAPGAVLMAWEGGACAFDPDDPDSPALAPAPTAQGRPHCPGIGLFPSLLTHQGPALAELPNGQTLHLPPAKDASAHGRLSWIRHFLHIPSQTSCLLHPFVLHGVALRRMGPIVGAFPVYSAWPLALRRLDL